MSLEHREANPSLHYYALQASDHDYYVILSTVPDAESCKGLGIRGDYGRHSPLLDLLEMWCCLMFQTLPEKYLREYLPKDIPTQENRGLNLHLPLHPSGSDLPEIRDILAESPDPLHQAYYTWKSTKFSTPSRSGLLSPPATRSKPAQGRFRSESSKQPSPSSPSMTRSRTTFDGESQVSILVKASNIDRSGHGKRKRDADSISDGEDLIGLPTKRTLTFENAAKLMDNSH
jgi:hypothetical protein